jgi:predicted Zn-dependent protease
VGRLVSATGLVPADVVVERALAASQLQGCVVVVEDRSEVEVRFANNTTTTNGVRRDRVVTVVAMRSTGRDDSANPPTTGTAVGIAARSGDVDVEELVRRAESEAHEASAAQDAAALIDAGNSDPDFGDPAPECEVEDLGPVCVQLAESFDAARAEGHLLAGFATQSLSTVALGSSTGLRRRFVQPEGTAELVARSADGARSAWVGRGIERLTTLDVGAMHETLTRRLQWARRVVPLPAGRYEVLLPPDAVADLVVPLAEAMSGRDALDGRSAFAAPGGGTKIGERIAPLAFELRGDPEEPGLACSPYLVTTTSGPDVSVFDNGMDLGRTRWLEDGTVTRLRFHRAGAAATGLPVAAPVGNLTLELPGASGSIDDLVGSTDRGLLLTCLWYIREVDPVTLLLTGLTRDGVYLVEDGEVVGAVNNFRFNESPLGVLARAGDAGASVRALSREWSEWARRTAMPPLRVADFNMSSVSPAT